jgi:dihydroorotase
LTEQGLLDGGLAVDKGRICSIGKASNLPQADDTLNAAKRIILPGLIDVHTHLRGLQLAYKEDFFTGTCAALAGGFTTILDMPNTIPPTNSQSSLHVKKAVAANTAVANLGFYSGIPATDAEIKTLAADDIVGFKLFLNKPCCERDLTDDETLLHLFNLVHEVDSIITIHAESRRIVERLEKIGRSSTSNDVRSYLRSHPPEAEVAAVNRVLPLVALSGVHSHFCHISTSTALDLISKAKKISSVTAEVTPHHLFLSRIDATRCGGIAVMDPPLRDEIESQRLWIDLIHGRVDLIASDHAPHTIEEKTRQNIWDVPPGIPGLETTLPLLLTSVVAQRLSLNQVVTFLAYNPANIFRLPRKGYLRPGYDADFIIVDLKKHFTLQPSTFLSKAKYSPFDGRQVTGKVVKIFVNGEMAMDEGELIAKPGSGTILRRSG